MYYRLSTDNIRVLLSRLLFTVKEQFEAARKLKEFHIKNAVVTEKDCDGLYNFLAWDMFVYGIILHTKISSKNKSNTYLYKFTCKSERNLFRKLLGLERLVRHKPITSHADDLSYLFPCRALSSDVDKKSKGFEIINKWTTLWTNFAKYGNPTPDNSLGVKWSPYMAETQQDLDIGNQLVEWTHPDKEDIDFWEAIFQQYLPHWTP